MLVLLQNMFQYLTTIFECFTQLSIHCKKNDNFHPCMWVEISQMGVNNHLFQVMVEI